MRGLVLGPDWGRDMERIADKIKRSSAGYRNPVAVRAYNGVEERNDLDDIH